MTTALKQKSLPAIAHRLDTARARTFPTSPSHYSVTSEPQARRVVLAVLRRYLDICREFADVDEWVGFDSRLLLSLCYHSVGNGYGLDTRSEAENGVFGLLEDELFRVEVRGGREIYFPTPKVLSLLVLRES